MINWDEAPAGAQIYANGSYFRQSPRYYREAEVWSVKYNIFAPAGVKLEDLKGYEDYQENPRLEIVKVKEMIAELKVGDYIEKSELDTEQKYNDVVEVFEQWGFSRNGEYALSYCDFMNHERENALVASNLVDFDCLLMGCDLDGKEIQRKLTYNDIMSLKKVDVDNCNIDKVVSGEIIRPYDPRKILQSCKDKELESLSRFVTGDDDLIDKGELLKLRAASNGLISLGYVWDEEEKAWCKIVKEYL